MTLEAGPVLRTSSHADHACPATYPPFPVISPDLSQLSPLLVPAPVRLHQRSGSVALPEGQLTFRGPAPVMGRPLLTPAADGQRPHVLLERGDAPTGGYTLVIDEASGDTSPIRITAADESGFRHALATLVQLLRQYGRTLPCLEIEDAPAFPTRGVMLDVSRNKVPTQTSLESYADLFASLKFNHLQLYTEHTFAYEGHEDVWRGCSPITPTEARRLDTFCAARGIDLAPNQNCFGHLARWLKLPAYAHLAETHGEWMFMRWPRSGPFSLCPTDPASEEFVRGLLGQLLPCFGSGLVNVGCDETFDVGTGRSRAEVERLGKGGRAAVYFDFVSKVCAIAASHGKRAMLWADIALSQPETLALWPRVSAAAPGVANPIGLAWGYEPDADFASWCDTLTARGIEPWVCPGTSSWRSITGRTAERNANLAAAAAARSHGATGFLVTDWGDCGHHQHWPISATAIAHAAQAAWNPTASADPRAISLHVFGDRSLEVAGWIDELGNIDEPIRRSARLRNASALFTDLHRPATADPIEADAAAWRDVADRLSDLERRAPRSADLPEPIVPELLHTLATAWLAVNHAVAMRESGGPNSAARARLVDNARTVLALHRQLWPLRNRPGGLEESCSHYEALIRRLGRA